MIRAVIEYDFEDIANWYERRLEKAPPRDWYGDAMGFIEPGVGAAFLYLASDTRAYAEDFVTNPQAPGKARWKAIGELAEAICKEAAERGRKYVVGFTRVQGMVARAVSLGFTAHPTEFRCVVRRVR